MCRFLSLLVIIIGFSCQQAKQQTYPAHQSQQTGQFQEPLIYFISKDSLIGVKDSKGKIVIPARGRWVFNYHDGDTVEEGFINLVEADDQRSWGGSFGKIYSRDGKFLYTPLDYDNGPDRIHEGLTRFVENGKIGFVDRHANKIIPAQFDHVGAFSLGTALFCRGGYYDFSEDREHPLLKGGVRGVIDRTGKILLDNIPYDTSIYFWKKLRSLHQQFYANQFIYSDFEKKLISNFDPYKTRIEEEYFSNWVGFPEPKSLRFDITERPSPGFPYYVVALAELVGPDIMRGDRLQFYISADGKNVFNYSWDGELIPFLKWFDEYLNAQ